jgi:predicted DNA-binding WGR domain protein
MSSTIYLECIDGKSNKFYELILNGNDVTSRYGPCGKPGVTGVKTFDSNAEAKKNSLTKCS